MQHRKHVIPFLPHCLLLLLLYVYTGALAQEPEPKIIDVCNIRMSQQINNNALLYIDTVKKRSQPLSLASIPFEKTVKESIRRVVPTSLVNKDMYLQFTLHNNADTTVQSYFSPGYYCDIFELYKKDSASGNYRVLDKRHPQDDAATGGFKELMLDAGEKAVFIAKIRFIKTSVNAIEPRIAQAYYLPTLISMMQNSNKTSQVITFTISGVLLMMIFYSLAVFIMNKSREFLYYCGHAFFMGLLFFLKAFLYKSSSSFNYFFETYFDFVIQCAGIFCYLLFLRTFLESRKQYPTLDKVLIAEQVITITGVALYSYLYLFSNNFAVVETMEMWVKYLWSACTVYFIIFSFFKKHKLLNYLALGHSFLLLSGLLSLYLISSSKHFGFTIAPIFNDALFYYETGIMIELVFFMVALASKNKSDIVERTREKERLLMEKEKSEFEKQMAILSAQQEERNRISADMHDELGSGITAIRLMSELVKAKMTDRKFPEVDKISNSANDLIGKMNTLIWTMKSSNDTVDNLAAYMRSYAFEFFENTNIECHFTGPIATHVKVISGEKRRNLFLCVKESLNNVLKHSQAKDVWIDFEAGEILYITIRDNGCGIDTNKIRQFSNGLGNMKKRMESIDGEFRIMNHQGTTTILSLRL